MRPSRKLLTTLLLTSLALSAGGCSGQDGSDGAPTRPNVLLIVVDTLRADKLGCYGSALGATPRTDALAREAVLFERAYAHAPWTLPSFASLLTSLYPPQHGAGGYLPEFRPLPESVRTLAECFRDGGYATAAIVNVDFLTAPFGMTQGFEHVDFETYPSNAQVRVAERVTQAALDWLGQARTRPFFMLVHYFDPHLVYAPPVQYRRKFAAPQDRDDASWVFGTRTQIIAYRQGRITFDEATIRRAEKLYDGEVAYTDHEAGRLLDGLDRLELGRSTIVVFTADHGEEFLNHGGFEHGHSLYEELLRVPLIIRCPERLKAGVVKATVAQVDVAPTLCALTGVEAGPAFVGRDLSPLMDGCAADDRPVIFQGNFWGPPHRGWLQDGHKLIVTSEGMKLFDLRSDPTEQRDLSAAEPERVQRMAADLRAAYKAMAVHVGAGGAPVELSPAEIERLEALGYLVP